MAGTTSPTSPPSPVIKFTRAVLLSSPKGVMLRSFCMEYTKLVNSPFPWRELGYNCPLDLLRAMDDVVRVEMARNGSVTLFGIGSESMFMPSWVKKAQGLAKTNIPHAPFRTANPSFDHYSQAVLTQLNARPCCNHHGNGPNGRWTSEVGKATSDKSHGPPCSHGEMLCRPHTGAKRSVAEQGDGGRGTLTAEGSWSHAQPGRRGRGGSFVRPHPPTSNVSMQLLRTDACKMGTTLMPTVQLGQLHGQSREKSHGQSREQSHRRSCEQSHGQSCEQSHGQSCEQSHRRSCEQSHGQSCEQSHGQSFEQSHGQSCEQSHRQSCEQVRSSDQGQCAGRRGAPVSDLAVPKSEPARDGSGCVAGRSSESVCAPWMESIVGKEVVWQFSGWAVTNSNGLTPVIASEVYSPEKVWLQLTVHVEKDLKEISRGIMEAKPPQLTTASEGDICCIRVPSTSDFRRATVKQLKLHAAPQKQAVVQFIDVGTDHVVVPMTHLHTLPSPFSPSSLPPLALRCRLWGVASTCSSGHWWELDSQLLRKLVHRKLVFARTWGREEAAGSEQVDLFLDPDGLQSVAEILVREGDYICFSGDHEEDGEVEKEEVRGRQFLFTEVKALEPLPQALGVVVGGVLLHSPWQRLQRTLADIDGPSL